jgi:hypothetical protein
MNKIAALFLRAKHWQIFLVLFGGMSVGQVAMIGSMATTAGAPEGIVRINPLIAVITGLLMSSFLGWFWSMGSFLSSIVQPALKLKMGFFRFALFYAAIYLPVFMVLFQSLNPTVSAVIMPFHFFAMYCIFYLLYFVSKSLVLVETGKAASFYDYAGPFFLIWFFPIGVWIIQPRINRLYADRTPQHSMKSVQVDT